MLITGTGYTTLLNKGFTDDDIISYVIHRIKLRNSFVRIGESDSLKIASFDDDCYFVPITLRNSCNHYYDVSFPNDGDFRSWVRERVINKFI